MWQAVARLRVFQNFRHLTQVDIICNGLQRIMKPSKR
jgi:virulence-associated protein VagC